MFNLLSVVVAVAISGFMAAAGVFYTGSAFTNMSAKAQAVQVLSAMEQIDAAWTMWSNDGNTTTASLPSSTVLTSATPPTYMSSYPPAINTATTFGTGPTAAGYVIDSTGTGGATAAGNETTNTGVYTVLTSTTGANACLEIAKSAGYVASTASSFTGLANITVNAVTVAVSGITTKAELDALGAVYRYFCVPLGTTTATIILGGAANTIAVGADTGKHVAYFKHM